MLINYKQILIYLLFYILLPFSIKAVTIASWGGAYTESQIKAYKDTFSNPDKIKFVSYNGGLDEIRNQVENNTVKWDILDVLPMDAITGCDEGIFQDISKYYKNFPKGPNNTNIIDDMKLTGIKNPTNCCVPQVFWSYVIFFDKNAFPGNKPSTVADFFDLKKFPGKRAINTWAAGPIQMAALSAGISIKNIEKELSTKKGLDKAMSELIKIEDDVIFWSSGSKPIELVKSGEVIMAIAYNGRIGASIITEGENFDYIWDSQVIDQEYLCLVSGTKKFDLAIEFLSHASSPLSLATASKYITYGPMRASSVDIIAGNEPWGPEGQYILPHIPNTPERLKNSVMLNPNFSGWNKINERYASWMGY